MTMPDKIPFVLKITGTRGAIGKCFVIRYRRSCGYFMTRYPNMKNIIPSEAQKKHRKLFGEALGYAKWIMSNPQRKQAFLNTLPPKKRRWQPFRWMVSYFMKASIQLKEKLRAKMQRSKTRLKPSIVNPLKHNYNKYQWQLSESGTSELGFGGIKRIYGRSTIMVVHQFLRMEVGSLNDKENFMPSILHLPLKV